MTRGRKKLAEIGLIPIGLDLDEAAAYVGLSPKSFRAAVAAGTYPPPMTDRRRKKVWNRLALEAALGARQEQADTIMEAIDDALREDVQRQGQGLPLLPRRRRAAAASR